MKKTSTIVLAIAVFTLTVAAAYAQRPVNVKMKFSGTAIDNSVINIQPNTTEDEDTFAGSGTLGPFSLRNVRAILNTPSSSSTCSGANDLYLTESAGGGVLHFEDGSLLYLQMTEGSDCINLSTGVANCALTFQIAGGTGRFQNAKGTLNFTEAVTPTLVSDSLGNPIFSAATGELTGQISGIGNEWGDGDGH
jgi:hypothetical protein